MSVMRERPDRGLVGLLDDDDAFREALAAALVSLGFMALQFCNSGELLAGVGRLSFDCLILDYHLPGMNGIDVYRRLCDAGFRVPAILLSAAADPDLAAKALAAGVLGCLAKPTRMGELEPLVVRAIAKGS